jgi:hypothetical protein
MDFVVVAGAISLLNVLHNYQLRTVLISVAAAKAEFFSISCNKLCKIMKIIM